MIGVGSGSRRSTSRLERRGGGGAEAGGQGAPGGRGGVVRTAERSGLPVGPEGAGGAAAAEARGQGTGGEVEVPAYEAMNRPGPVGQRMLEILLAGVSTRKYARVIPAMAETVGVSRSAVSRETTLASERVLEELMERRLDGWDLLVIYLDGIQFGDYHVLGAVGVDVEGKKHVLGVHEGASENAEVARALLGGPGRAGRGHRALAAVCVGRIEGVEVGARPGVRAPMARLPQEVGNGTKHLPDVDVDVAQAGGWKSTHAMKASYQQSRSETMLRVVEGACGASESTMIRPNVHVNVHGGWIRPASESMGM